MATSKLSAALKLAEERNLRFVSLQFTDIVGQVKSVQVPMHQLTEAVEHGKWFDGSSIEGFARIAESDMFLLPDLSTFRVIPWDTIPGKRHARVICNVFLPDGTPFVGDPRGTLQRMVQKAREMGYEPNPLARRLANGWMNDTVCIFSGHLDVGLATDPDAVHIAADDGIHPDAAFFTDLDVADHLSAVIDECGGVHTRED